MRLNNNNNNNSDQQNTNILENYSCKTLTIFGIPIYIHYFLPLYFILSFILWLQIMLKDRSHFGYYIALLLLLNIILWWTVLIHEFGHAFAGYLIGGHTDKILLWPLGGLAFTSPPPVYNNIAADESTQRYKMNPRCAQMIIAIGGPLTHIPHMLLWGILFWMSANVYNSGVLIGNPFVQSATWSQTIFTPIVQWFAYDIFMLAFSLNFWLFLINMCPAYPLDGSRFFMNLLLNFYGVRTTAQVYCVVNGVIGVGLIIVAVGVLKFSALPFFGGIWCCFETYNMVQAVRFNQEGYHPLFQYTS